MRASESQPKSELGSFEKQFWEGTALGVPQETLLENPAFYAQPAPNPLLSKIKSFCSIIGRPQLTSHGQAGHGNFNQMMPRE
jgi:hypothetical protein